ncbi:MAG: hypothetical protein CM15mP4_2770 [Candidatus Neomarinimicrobiota bacterium]|nr:MAG: hypothetical protein CM15mP4_2770 [Candidatus Neomarinimicrobiota bacterium]
MFEKDVEYVFQDGKIMIVDEFTESIAGRKIFRRALYQALEAKEM